MLEKREEKPAAAASSFQAAVYRTPDDWKSVIGAFKKAGLPEGGAVLDRLFTEWQPELARRSVSREMDDDRLACTWIHWLIAAGCDAPGGRSKFMGRVLDWLRYLRTDGKANEQSGAFCAANA